jgi:Raf kinase inhibitor-like YbhB/YbcL family protein
MRSGLANRKALMSARGFAQFAAVLPVCLLILPIACRNEPELVRGQAAHPMQIRSSSFTNGGVIPQGDTCDGAGLSPGLQWSAPPSGTKTLALVMHDPDALMDFTHWIAFNIPPAVQSLPEGASQHSGLPQGTAEGTNGFGNVGYGGPCPPGGKLHHYIFKIYALDLRLELPTGADRKQIDAAMSGHILAEGEVVGVYRRAIQ